MKHLFLDIETAGIDPARQLEIAPRFEAPANYTDPQKIAAAQERKKAEWLVEAPLDPHRAEVIAVGYAVDDGMVDVVVGEERQILERLIGIGHDLGDEGLRVVGHNIIQFDLPVLNVACLRHGLCPPSTWMGLRPHGNRWVFDTMTDYCALYLNNTRERIGLDKLAWVLGVGRKAGNGGDFAALLARDPDAARGYVMMDVELTRRIYRRICR